MECLIIVDWCRSASLDLPLVDLSNPADARPAIASHWGEVFQAVEVGGDIGSLFFGGFVADGEGLVDVIDAEDFEVVGAFGVSSTAAGEGEQSEYHEDQLHNCRFIIINLWPFNMILSSEVMQYSNYDKNLYIVRIRHYDEINITFIVKAIWFSDILSSYLPSGTFNSNLE